MVTAASTAILLILLALTPRAASAVDATWSPVTVSGYVPAVPDPWIVVDSTRSVLYAFRDWICGSYYCGPDSLYTYSFADSRWLPAQENVGWRWVGEGLNHTRNDLFPVLDTAHDRLVNLSVHAANAGLKSDSAFVWSLSSPGNWIRLPLNGPLPVSRTYAGIAYDPSRDVFWMSGGTYVQDRFSYVDQIDTWSLDASSWTWTLRATGTGVTCPLTAGEGPVWSPVRMFLDSWGDRLVAVSGFTESAGICVAESLSKAIWQMPLAGPYVWNRVTPYSASFPPGPYVFDSNRGRVLAIDLATGAVSENRLNGDAAWTPLQVTGSPPPVRIRAVAAFDAANDRVILYGGKSPDLTQTLTDLWVLTLDHTTPVTASVVKASAVSGGIAVEWAVGGASAGPVGIERRRDDGPWTRLTESAPDGAGRVRCLDRDVEPGHRYGYRLSLGEGASPTIAGEVWVSIRARELALAAGPNPAADFIDVRFSLPAVGEARLELFDVSGRRIESRTVTGAGISGEGVERFGVSPRLRPGLYRVRLTQGGLRRQSSVVLVR